MDKQSWKIVKPTKDMVLCQLSSLGVKVQAIIAGTSYAFWDILVPTKDEAVTLTRKTLENQEFFFHTKYMGRRQTPVSVYEVLSFLRDANLATYMLNFGDIVSATHDGMRGKWRLDIMLDIKTFYSVPNWLDVEGRMLTVIASGRKRSCWHCSDIGHLFAVCPEKKAPKKPDQNPGTLPSVLINNEKEAPTSVGIKTPTPAGRKIQPLGPHSWKSSQMDTNSSPHSQSDKYHQFLLCPINKIPKVQRPT